MVKPGVGAMTESEKTIFIKEHKTGVLSLMDGDRPYSVPLEHYFDGKSLHIIISSRENQRKVNCIKNNANACYVIYDSRRDNPEIVSKRLRCRSVIIEGKVSLYFKDMKKGNEVKKVQMLRLDIENIGNWICPRQVCDWRNPWYAKHPELI
ncbi:hypothetical protein C4544_05965 [candidate division WS5 bacterium]|jgi:nitroimidazol reductase NimA-like FMN-containing flavoprotein (pyridoxamine 5'-phosphate oxidase superfamily)|uniref:Pyridoxamine 5'-phosphate oxidase family protein n=1 Tax=candidate division WS5 bacterium TaxID=2093353 RepID=A0A419DAQ2_9BACT|nr:MAG: hypothetical protein C4544_05965 [candidate division WS5 bacterium]